MTDSVTTLSSSTTMRVLYDSKNPAPDATKSS